jgi:hypothetical protein
LCIRRAQAGEDSGSFPEVKRLGRVVNYPLPSSDEVKEIVDLQAYLLLPVCAFIAGYRVNFTF